MKKGIGTMSIHTGNHKNPFGALAVPIYQTSTFVFDSAEQGGKRFALEEEGYIYSRLGNPTTAVFEEKIAALEGGEAAVATSSGIGAITSTLWTLLKAGDHVIADKTLYGCTFAYLNHGVAKFGVEVDFIDTSDLELVRKTMKSNTRVVYLETPANPNMKVVDIKAVAEIAHTNPNTLVVVDNTFATPFCQRPLELGCDVVVHSVTKYLNGHGDVIAGVVISKKEIIDQVRLVGVKDMTGSVLGPTEAFYIIRGMKTFELRMRRHCENAMKVAEYLEAHDKIEKVYYPGLKSHDGYEVASKQMDAFGGILAFELKGGFEAGKTLLNNVKMAALAVSLGDAETLIQHPASMTHSPYTKEERLAAGITDGLVRLSVGLENIEDIIADLEYGLAQIK
ncbi:MULTISPECIES: methionine gamma-lyase [Fusobacterium]|jgi:methionine-gamma-lyase|uniref:L-methionine gamma-lyase n=1 Tax=Fusobacterium mortiferum ATCC 9817 TaxID=469616 RepID=A0ABM6TUZ5_FUSMR|nr:MULTISPECIES: methionine gamma-lyase [Fusobacterium]AVQ18392.1 methionine gamma-lyase [Fusobacterium mortiferum ATCC 9817]EEO34627.1 methionine gamma-lyase [Fusobacterium mortiferum ATCC 9817]MCF2699767.1 methionine gamma-lyase [Fusobacterium mortiferum]MCI7187395.1 methionine gamma-lyase [Fusobacterium mortiferum]MCI7666637.1 methionine gamma-lyase [Fusobacterium mortiferum]